MYKSILVLLDGSELAECSLPYAIAIAKGCQPVDVTLLTVIEIPEQIYVNDSANQIYVERMLREQEQQQKQATEGAKKYLAAASSKLSGENISPKTVIIQSTPPQRAADVILDYAKNNAIDLIILSTHGRSGITRWAMGSTADRVVRSSLAPVLTISSPGCRQ
jgi:nucleotide-binding universal stress UspA family protein